ncbi:MAG: hypothetical protein JO197_17770 [Acidobacteria bacterium]|nr:hypothetical protein [Acidobacteriota bacterium]MBV9478953.1 hypothetical protein [Acidobacteriota bacterium]
MTALHELRFRSSPDVALKPLAALTAEEREAFRELEEDAEFYGLLVARPPLTMNLKAAPRQTAELFLALADPSPLDANLLADDEYRNDVVDLVLDGILEIDADGTFVSGADALPLVCPTPRADASNDAIARLSRDALLHAEDLATRDVQTLTSALYHYNRIPLSPFWRARFADRDAVLAQLGAAHGSLRAMLERDWVPVASEHASGWLSWFSRAARPNARATDDVTHKLYISPRPERIRDAFEIVVRVLADFPGTQFKIGQDAAGLLRPDKLVAYFVDRAQLDAAAAALARELAGCDAHGVPFTAGIDADGLLSWGVDPPQSDRALRWLGRESWRLWVAKRLAAALAIAKSARTAHAADASLFAVARAQRQGVDVATWAPAAGLWSLQ